MALTRKRKQEQEHFNTFPFNFLRKDLQIKIIMLLGPFNAGAAQVSKFFYQHINTRKFWLRHFIQYFPSYTSDLEENHAISLSKKFGTRFLEQKRRLGQFKNNLFLDLREGKTSVLAKIKLKDLEPSDDNDDSILDIAARMNLAPLQEKSWRIGQKYYKYKTFLLADQNKISFAVSCRRPLEELAKLAAAGIDVDPAIDSQNRSATHVAAEYGYDQHLQFLLEHGAQVDRAYKECWTSLGIASYYNQVKCARVLLNFNADINYQNGKEGNTAVHIAARFSHLDMLSILITSGANLEAINNDRRTPLDVALANNHTHAAIMLVEAGALLRADNESILPITRAIALGNPELVQAMMNKGALDYINESRDPRTAIVCIIKNKLHIMWLLLENGMTTFYRASDVVSIIQTELTRHGDPEQLFRFQKLQQKLRTEVENIDIYSLAMLLGTDEMQGLCKKPDGHANSSHIALR